MIYALYHTGDYRFSEHLCRQILEKNPDDIRQRTNLGEILIRRGQTDAGIAELLAVVQAAPNFPLIHQNLWFAFAATGEEELAKKYRQNSRMILQSGSADTRPFMLANAQPSPETTQKEQNE